MAFVAQLLLGLVGAVGLVLIWGGIGRIGGGDRRRGWLMVAAGLVMLANVLIWVV